MLRFRRYGGYCRRDFFRLRARTFDRFEQTGSGPIARGESNSRFRKRFGRVVRDHRRAHSGVERTVVKDDFRFTDLNATTGGQMDHAFDCGAVVECAVCGPEILKHVFVTFAAHFRVNAGRERIRNTEIVSSGTADSYTKPAEWKVVGVAVGVFNY